MTDPAPSFGELPLRERMPEYLAFFGVLIAVGVVLGALIGLFVESPIPVSIGYTLMLLGTGLLLVGGLSGSGLTAGGFGSIFTGRSDEEERRRLDEHDNRRAAERRAKGRGVDVADEGSSAPEARMRRKLQSGPNPRAFWSIAGGVALIAIGIGVVSLFP